MLLSQFARSVHSRRNALPRKYEELLGFPDLVFNLYVFYRLFMVLIQVVNLTVTTVQNHNSFAEAHLIQHKREVPKKNEFGNPRGLLVWKEHMGRKEYWKESVAMEIF